MVKYINKSLFQITSYYHHHHQIVYSFHWNNKFKIFWSFLHCCCCCCWYWIQTTNNNNNEREQTTYKSILFVLHCFFYSEATKSYLVSFPYVFSSMMIHCNLHIIIIWLCNTQIQIYRAMWCVCMLIANNNVSGIESKIFDSIHR